MFCEDIGLATTLGKANMLNRRSSWASALNALFVVAVCFKGDGFPTGTASFVSGTQETNTIVSQGYASEINLARTEAKRICGQGHPAPGNSKTADGTGRVRPPGVSVAVAIDGEIVWAEGFGLADVEQNVPVTRATKFRIGSTSKSFTAVAAILLSERGRLDLDAPIQRYVPSFPDKGYVITTRQLLLHRGGIRHYNEKERHEENQRRYSSVSEGLERFENDPLISVPGTETHYSSYGYNLVSAVVEGASGRDFLSFMRDQIFRPLGMQDTTADENEKIIPYRGRFYQINADGTYRNSRYADLSYKWGSGGFLSSSEDLVKFGSAFLKPGFVDRNSLDLMFVPKPTQEARGVGWSVYEEGERAPERIYTSDGSSVGGSSVVVIYPDQKVVISWVMNTDDFHPLNDKDLRKVALPFLERQNLLLKRGQLSN